MVGEPVERRGITIRWPVEVLPSLISSGHPRPINFGPSDMPYIRTLLFFFCCLSILSSCLTVAGGPYRRSVGALIENIIPAIFPTVVRDTSVTTRKFFHQGRADLGQVGRPRLVHRSLGEGGTARNRRDINDITRISRRRRWTR